MPNETFDGYKQVFEQLKRLFDEYKIDNLDIFIYNRDRAAINALQYIFPSIKTILCIQYIDIVVKANAYKIFGQQKDPARRRYIPSKLADEFIALYRNYRLALTEEAFDKAYGDLAERAKYDYDDSNDSDNSDQYKDKEELDIIARLVNIRKEATTTDKNIPARQLKAERYLQKAQQPYKELYVKAQIDQLLYFGFNVSSIGEGAYRGLKKQTQSARNNTLTIVLKIMLFFDSYLNRYVYTLSKAQNTTSSRFVNNAFYYYVNTVITIRGLKLIYQQKQKLDTELKRVANERDYVRPTCTSVFAHIIKIDCLYKLEGIKYLTARSFDEFYYIRGTTNTPVIVRLLKPKTQLRKRIVRLARSY